MKKPVWCALLVIAAGCGGPETESTMIAPTQSGDAGAAGSANDSDTAPEKASGAALWDPALGTATVVGVVKFTGDPPRRRPIDMAGKAECADLHSDPVLDESVVVNDDGTLQNAFVWVQKGLNKWQFPTPEEPVELDQKGCTFYPHVVGVQEGQPIKIRNSDNFAHNVHAIPNRNSGFNFTQSQGQEDIRQFDTRDVMVYMKCDIHGWMSSYIGVVPHPYFATTGEDGSFELPNLPPGDYVIEANHEALGKQRQDVTVVDGETIEIEFSFEEQ